MIRAWFAALAIAAAGQAAASTDVPELHVKTLDGTTFDLSAQRGKWVIVNYWATWCVPCIKEMPDISAFVKAHPDVTAVGLAFEDTPRDEVQAFLKKHAVSYPIAQVDPTEPPKDLGEPRGLPTTWIIGPDGRVVKRIVGPVTQASLASVITEKHP